MKRLVLFFGGIFLCGSLAFADDITSDDASLYIEDALRRDDNLYLRTPADIDKVKKVIYVVSDNQGDFFKFFKKYADRNKSIGGRILQMKDPLFLSFAKRSRCNLSHFKDAVLVLEDRIAHQCYYFPSKNESELFSALVAVDRGLESGQVKREYSKRRISDIIDSLDNKIVSNLKGEILLLFEALWDFSGVQ